MIWLAISIGLMLLSWISILFKSERLTAIINASYFFALIIWLAVQSDFANLGNGEEGLLRWFAWGLGIVLIRQIFIAGKVIQSKMDFLASLAAFFYSLGLDPFRPDSYALIPASIMAILTMMLAIRIGNRILPGVSANWRIERLFTVLSISAYALLMYASIYKLMDRGWSLPWSYLVAGGALMFGLSQLWVTWSNFHLSDKKWKFRIKISYQLGHLLLITSAFFHYQQYF